MIRRATISSMSKRYARALSISATGTGSATSSAKLAAADSQHAVRVAGSGSGFALVVEGTEDGGATWTALEFQDTRTGRYSQTATKNGMYTIRGGSAFDVVRIYATSLSSGAISGELYQQAHNSDVVQADFNTRPLTPHNIAGITANAVYRSSPGRVGRVIVNTGAALGVVKIYDNTVPDTTNIVGTFDATTSHTFELNVELKNGLSAAVSGGAADVTITEGD